MENDLQQQLNEQQKALAKIYQSVEKTRKMILWSGIATVVTFLAPLIIVVFMLPRIIGTFTASIGGLETSTVNQTQTQSFSDSLNALQSLGF